jgi:hypothetical protein
MSLRKRLQRLERSGVVPCSECGQLAGDNETKIRLRTADEGADEPEGIHYCPRCGRMTRALIKLKWT